MDDNHALGTPSCCLLVTGTNFVLADLTMIALLSKSNLSFAFTSSSTWYLTLCTVASLLKWRGRSYLRAPQTTRHRGLTRHHVLLSKSSHRARADKQSQEDIASFSCTPSFLLIHKTGPTPELEVPPHKNMFRQKNESTVVASHDGQAEARQHSVMVRAPRSARQEFHRFQPCVCTLPYVTTLDFVKVGSFPSASCC